MRPLAALALLAMPAAAQDRAFWETTGCQLVPVTGQAWVAELHCQNFLTSMTPADVEAELRIDGLAVHLTVNQTFGRVPDSFTVTPPDGYAAVPPVLVLDEETSGVVQIMPWVGF